MPATLFSISEGLNAGRRWRRDGTILVRARHNSQAPICLRTWAVFALKGDQLAALAFLTGRCALSLDTRAIDYHEHKNCTPPPTCAYPLTKTNCPEVMNYALAHNGGRWCDGFCARAPRFISCARTSSEGIKMQTFRSDKLQLLLCVCTFVSHSCAGIFMPWLRQLIKSLLRECAWMQIGHGANLQLRSSRLYDSSSEATVHRSFFLQKSRHRK
jgi:hypothetical protein